MNCFFYKENCVQKDNIYITISPRFLGTNGQAMQWEIRPLTQMQNEEILKACGFPNYSDEKKQYEELLLAESVVFPDLHDMQLQNSYGVIGSGKILSVMLTPGEYEYLKKVVQELCA